MSISACKSLSAFDSVWANRCAIVFHFAIRIDFGDEFSFEMGGNIRLYRVENNFINICK